MLKSELMDLLHDLAEDTEVYIELYENISKVRKVYIDGDGDIILEAN